MIILFLTFLLFYSGQTSPMTNGPSPIRPNHHLQSGYTCRIHTCPHPDVTHISLYNDNCVITRISVPNLWVEKIKSRGKSRTTTHFKGYIFHNSTAIRLDLEDGKKMFNELKVQYDLANEPLLVINSQGTDLP